MHSQKQAPLDKAYDESFFSAVDRGSREAAGIVAPALLDLAQARSVIDVGCGHGVWLSVIKDLGVERIHGVDGTYVDRSRLRISPEEFTASDLEFPISLEQRFDLAISLEVAEHLSPSRSESFVADLCRLAPVVFFSAAIPHQGGTNHINERPQSDWAAIFAQHGYRPADELRWRFWDDWAAGVVYSQNALLYVSEEALSNPRLREAVEATDLRTLDVVHPVVLAKHDSLQDASKVNIGGLLRAFPLALHCSLRGLRASLRRRLQASSGK